MEQVSSHDVTQLLNAWRNGDDGALQKLIPLVYRELHRLAASYMRREDPNHTLQTTALVNEAYCRLVDQKTVWHNRAHFFGIAAQLMRRILLDHAKGRVRQKRGGSAEKISLDEAVLIPGPQPSQNDLARCSAEQSCTIRSEEEPDR